MGEDAKKKNAKVSNNSQNPKEALVLNWKVCKKCKKCKECTD